MKKNKKVQGSKRNYKKMQNFPEKSFFFLKIRNKKILHKVIVK